ncbi:MAG: ThiF family adenylyltransferase [Brevundimonas sp.]|uniref:ThiF family adenylyltransferase n=1 Tax=Brevundimonas sp. TaxID=1871086 RepID=UPI002AB89DDA|nr:ThiF family adenylyltransferase [Brevundimonas sp.]MDZ4113270.1 ThiF family adenylyltransferase [Brevundimonas sp.]
MTIWYLSAPYRLAEEHETLLALKSRESWLELGALRPDENGRLCIDVEIATAGRSYAARLRYPHTFPFSPPSVVPKTPEAWSGHQYGSGGELCLEWGADNWTPELTGAHMIESAERLLSGEATIEGERPGRVPSRHDTTLGQDLRFKSFRLVVTETFAAHMRSLAPGSTRNAKLLWTDNDKQHALAPVHLTTADGEQWTDPSTPQALWANNTLYGAKVWRLPDGVVAPPSADGPELRAFMAAHGYCAPPDDGQLALDLLLTWDDAGARLRMFSKDSDDVYDFTVVAARPASRLPRGYSDLADKTVGLVGCGSAGSKIAASLARAGAGHLILVDDDILLPENLVRNDLDWTVMGEHKVRGVARRADLAAPGVRIDTHIKRLAAQEASGVADGILHSLQQCDLIIDATAEPAVFNLLAGVVSAARKPLIWLEVFAGGIGGLVARSRPGLDPSPQTARAKIEAWCASSGAKPPRADRPYEANGEAEPMIADDADVTVIAAHAARMALDLLTETSPSAFPQSAYMIGLREGWLFTQPFDTRAIDLGQPEAAAASPSAEASAAGAALLVQMIKELQGEAADPS